MCKEKNELNNDWISTNKKLLNYNDIDVNWLNMFFVATT